MNFWFLNFCWPITAFRLLLSVHFSFKNLWFKSVPFPLKAICRSSRKLSQQCVSFIFFKFIWRWIFKFGDTFWLNKIEGKGCDIVKKTFSTKPNSFNSNLLERNCPKDSNILLTNTLVEKSWIFLREFCIFVKSMIGILARFFSNAPRKCMIFRDLAKSLKRKANNCGWKRTGKNLSRCLAQSSNCTKYFEVSRKWFLNRVPVSYSRRIEENYLGLNIRSNFRKGWTLF